MRSKIVMAVLGIVGGAVGTFGCGDPNAGEVDASAPLDARAADAQMDRDGGSRDGGGPRDDGAIDSGAIDSGAIDSGAIDSGAIDSGPTDDGAIDSGATDDAALDGGPSLDAAPDGGPNTGFRLVSATAMACTFVDHNTVTGDDRGGIAVGRDHVLISGDDATAVYDAELMTGAPVGGPIVGTLRDVMVNDVGDGTVYVLANAAGPLGLMGGPDGVATMITRLQRMNADGMPVAAGEVTLSMAIPITPMDGSSNVGLFAGRGQIGIHDGTSLFVIDVATGAVTAAGAVSLPASITLCENWAYWGLLERTAGGNALVAVAGNDIVRIAVPSGTVTTVASFTDLSDMCGIAASLPLNRWYFHHENTSQFAAATNEALGYCSATYSTTGADFTVGTLEATGCTVIDVTARIGDDRTGIAVTPSHVFLSGDGSLGRWTTDLTAPVSSSLLHDALVTNLRTAEVWSLATASDLLGDVGGIVTRLVGIDPADGTVTAREITLSAPITLPDSGVGLFSGSNEIAIHDGTNVHLIELPSGTVTNLGAMDAPAHSRCENWAYWGLLERFGGARHLALVTSGRTAIERFRIPDGAREVISSFTSLADMCSISVSISRNRWYWHHEGGSELTGGTGSEMLGYCDAMFETPVL